MDGLDATRLAELAGAKPSDIERMASLGILGADADGRFSDADIQRVRLCLACERAGISLAQVGRAISDGHLSFAYFDTGFARWPPLEGTTFDEACRVAGVQLDFLQRAYEALEHPRPEATDRVRQDDQAIIDLCQAGLATGLGDDVALRAFRAYGENLRRLADAIHQLYHSNLELPLLASGMSERQMREVAAGVSTVMIPLTDRLVMSTYHRHLERIITADIVSHLEDALEASGMHRRRQADPPAMGFVDLAGYTRLTEERGDHAAAELASNLSDVVRDAVVHHGGRPVKWLGDGVMLFFPDPGEAVEACLEMTDSLAAAGLPEGHTGVSAGPVVQQDGDFYGRTVNLAARISSKAGPSEVLVSDEVVARATGGVEFEPVGTFELKGFAQPVALYRATASGGGRPVTSEPTVR